MVNFNRRTFGAELKKGEFAHIFGGAQFEVVGVPGVDVPPTLIFSLDTQDTRVWPFGDEVWRPSSIPVCSYVNNEAWYDRQEYTFDENIARFVQCGPGGSIDIEDRLPNPLPETNILLTPLLPSDSFDSVTDSLMGGLDFVRVGGVPLWLFDALAVTCGCGSAMHHLLTLGYENYSARSYMSDKPWFIGEAALYFFVCPKCLLIAVECQG